MLKLSGVFGYGDLREAITLFKRVCCEVMEFVASAAGRKFSGSVSVAEMPIGHSLLLDNLVKMVWISSVK